MAVKNRLKEVLKEVGVSQTELAQGVKVNKSTISNIINNKNDPSLKLAIDIAKYLNKTIEDIFYEEEDYENFVQLLDNIERMITLYNEGVMTINGVEFSCTDLIRKYIDKYSKKVLQDHLEVMQKRSGEKSNQLIISILHDMN